MCAAVQLYTKATNVTLGSQVYKAVYRQYTDNTFTTLVEQHPLQGLVGPTLRAEVGDRLVIHLKNRLSFEAGIQIFGGLALLSSTPEGNTTAAPAGRRLGRRLQQFDADDAVVVTATSSLANSKVAPNATMIFEWAVPLATGPGPKDGLAVAYSYNSFDRPRHNNAGRV